MVHQTWTFDDTLELGPSELPVSAKDCTVRMQRLRGGKKDGVDLVVIENNHCRFAIVPTRGMGLWRAWCGERREHTIGWESPVNGPVHPALVPLTEPSGLGWLEGFDELVVRCGLLSNGAPDFDEHQRLIHPLHGRIANIPAENVRLSVDDETGEITLTGEVAESRFLFHNLRLTASYSVLPGVKGVRIRDQVTNLSGVPAEFQLLYHVNFGPPFLEEGARPVAPVAELAPRDAAAQNDVSTWDRCQAPTAGYREQVHYFRLAADRDGRTMTLLKNAAGSLGVSLEWNTRELPCFTFWKNTVAREDGYVAGMEPGTNYPNPRSHEKAQDRIVLLASGASLEFELRLGLYTSADEVTEVERTIAELQKQVEPVIHLRPQRGWSQQ